MAKNSESTLVNLQASQLAAQVANWAAQLDFQKERMRLLELPQMQAASQATIDRLAFDKAQATWENSFKEASISGTYQGKPTTQWLTEQAQLTGVLNGQQTLQGKLTDAQIAQMNTSMVNTQRLTDLEYAKYNTGREQWDAQHAMELEKQQAQLTGYIQGLPTFEREQWTASNKLATANLIASLSGPASAFKQVAVIRSLTGVEPTIGGVTSSIQAVLQGNGQTVAGYGQGTGGAPPANPYSPYYAQNQGASQSPANVAPPGSVVAPISGTTPPAPTTVPTPTIPPYQLSPSGVQADPTQYNYEPTATGGTTVYPPGVIAPYATPQASTTVPVDPATQATLASQAGYTPPTTAQPAQSTQPTTNTGLLPWQINAKNYNNQTGYEQQMDWAGFEDAQFGSGAWDKSLAQDLYKKSLPKYAAPTTGRVAL